MPSTDDIALFSLTALDFRPKLVNFRMPYINASKIKVKTTSRSRYLAKVRPNNSNVPGYGCMILFPSGPNVTRIACIMPMLIPQVARRVSICRSYRNRIIPRSIARPIKATGRGANNMEIQIFTPRREEKI